MTATMKHRYANKVKNNKNEYLNNPPVINKKKSRKIISIKFQKCKNNSLKICNNMIKLCNLHAAIESKC